MTMDIERPRSGYARKKDVLRNQDFQISKPVYVDKYSARVSSDDGLEEAEYEPLERPQTSRGHRAMSHDHGYPEVDEVYGSPAEQYDSYDNQPLYNDRPQTARSRRRHSTQERQVSHVGYEDDDLLDYSGIHSGGFDRQICDDPVSSRPGTASLSKYAVLPGIGNRRPSARLQRETTFVLPESTERKEQRRSPDNAERHNQRKSMDSADRRGQRRSPDIVEKKTQRSSPESSPSKNQQQWRKSNSASASSTGSVDRNQKSPQQSEEELDSSSWHVDELQRQISNISLDGRGDNVEVVLLAVKLPSGQRIQGQFRSTDKLLTVMSFGEKFSNAQFKGCSLVCHHPRAVYSDMNVTIRESGLQSRTVLYIETE